MKLLTRILALLLAIAAPALVAQTRTDAEKDPLLKAMLAELDRSKAELKLEEFERPFFIQYQLTDMATYQTAAEFGSTTEEQSVHLRRIHVIVRVGNHKTDSSSPTGDGYINLGPGEDDPIALRTAFWWATDNAYKQAISAYTQKTSELKQLQTAPQADDFSVETPTIHLEPVAVLDFDRKPWPARVAELSGLYRTAAELKEINPGNLEQSTADFSAVVRTTYLVNTEGTIVRKSTATFQEQVSFAEQAPDGMRLHHSTNTTGATVAELEAPEKFRATAIDKLKQFERLRTAPLIAEEYHGPVLYSGRAAAGVLERLFVPNVEASRPKPGTEIRTNGAYASSLHMRILPAGISVVDDPLMKQWKGRTLLGSYAVDDEGVPAQSVKLVEEGKLESYLMDRQPIRDFPVSNGHGRANFRGAIRTGIGVLKVSAQDGQSEEQMQAKLKAAMDDAGVDHAYYSSGAGLLFRVDAKGERTLVRGATIEGLDQRALRSGVLAIGSEPALVNSAGDVPSSLLVPAMLFGDMTVKRAEERNNKLPFYPSPLTVEAK